MRGLALVLVLAACDEVSPAPQTVLLTLSSTVLLHRARSVDLPLEIVRDSVYGDAVISVSGLPVGVEASAPTIPAGRSRGVLTLSATADAVLGGPASLRVVASVGSITGDAALELTVAGAPGALDETWGGTGVVVTPVLATAADGATSVAALPDGSVVVAAGEVNPRDGGDFVALRYLVDGGLDPTFGTGGISTIPVTTDERDVPLAIAPLDGGKLLLAGYTFGALAATRLDTAGNADNDFDVDGVLLWDKNSADELATSAVPLPGGDILLAGVARFDGYDDYDFLLLRLLADGQPDPSFGPDGARPLRIGPGSEYLYAAARQPDGKVVLVGSSKTDLERAVIARVDAAGELDPTFAQGGWRTFSLPGRGDCLGTDTAIQPDGRILVAFACVGVTNSPGPVGAVRLDGDGALDRTFGNAGVVTFPVPGWTYRAAVALQTDGRVVLAWSSASDANRVALVRVEPSGQLDTDFGDGGEVADALLRPVNLNDMTLAPDGRIVVVGETTEGFTADTDDLVVARFWP